MSAGEIYDQIGADYGSVRKADPRWIARIHKVLQDERTLVNVGAGAGSYEPGFMSVVGVEPSEIMIRQRPSSAAPVVCAVAERLPFPDGAFDVALAILTVHHWSDPAAGLEEMRRVSRKQVVVTWDPEVFARQFWLVRDYVPEAAERETQLATLAKVLAHLVPAAIESLPVPADCTDGFFGAYWKRPRAYLDPTVRGGISGLALLDQGTVSAAMERLKSDLDHGRWRARYQGLMELCEIDLGYRLVVAEDPQVLRSSASGEPMQVRIMLAGVEDAVEILTLQKTAYQREARLYEDWTIPPLTQTLPETQAEFKSKTFLKAVHSDGIVGSVRACLEGGTCGVGRLIVHPDHQGKGVGTRLMSRIEAVFAQAERFELFTGSKSSDNIRLYQRLGYRVCREENLSPKVRLVFMEKRK